MAGLDPAIHVLAKAKKGVDARHKAGHDEFNYPCSFLWPHSACSHSLIGATSIQRFSFQLCSAHSASCTPLAPSSSVCLYDVFSQTWRMNISHCSLKPL